ncbi:hypothetical protein DVA67_011935 [Solirubrobacter sp. CPCC 204708]|uniref:Uncharacterized protein n=1 Tax=Solirubrobacter deserti TaxID=2282478 RepID=A0ABT4RLK8_9ACTN|nr:hypothetical protein [Solirubrobacter deserti]MBE2316687.1 hypothetical protein [Solirubrobacter deserti]MDA0139444.1 hypothetical protein [Solirubrobacter deserti]
MTEIDGIEVWLERVTLRSDAVAVALRAQQNDATRTLDSRYEAVFEAWAEMAQKDRQRGRKLSGQPPAQPGEWLAEIPLHLGDDAGTKYRPVKRQAAGTGTEWEATWVFSPAPAERATAISIWVGDPDDRSRVHVTL